MRTFEIKLPDMVKKNISVVLAGGAIGFAVAATMLAVKAGKDASKAIEEREEELTRELDRTEKLKATWKYFIPPTLALTMSTVSIISLVKTEERKSAALAALYASSEAAFGKYRDKVRNDAKVSKKKEEEYYVEAQRETTLERAKINNLSEFVDEATGHYPIMDSFSRRVFKSSREEIELAAERTRRRLAEEGLVTLADFYDELGLVATEVSYDYGWDYSTQSFEYRLYPDVTDGGAPCFHLSYEPSHRRY